MHPAHHRRHSALLADPRPLQDSRHAEGVARTAGLRADLRRHSILLVEFHGRRAGGYPRRHRHPAGAGLLLPQGLEPTKNLALPRRSGRAPAPWRPAPIPTAPRTPTAAGTATRL